MFCLFQYHYWLFFSWSQYRIAQKEYLKMTLNKKGMDDSIQQLFIVFHRGTLSFFHQNHPFSRRFFLFYDQFTEKLCFKMVKTYSLHAWGVHSGATRLVRIQDCRMHWLFKSKWRIIWQWIQWTQEMSVIKNGWSNSIIIFFLAIYPWLC